MTYYSILLQTNQSMAGKNVDALCFDNSEYLSK